MVHCGAKGDIKRNLMPVDHNSACSTFSSARRWRLYMLGILYALRRIQCVDDDGGQRDLTIIFHTNTHTHHAIHHHPNSSTNIHIHNEHVRIKYTLWTRSLHSLIAPALRLTPMSQLAHILKMETTFQIAGYNALSRVILNDGLKKTSKAGSHHHLYGPKPFWILWLFNSSASLDKHTP